MGRRIGRIDKLAGDKAAGELPGQLLRFGDGPRHALVSGGEHQLRAVGLHDLAALYAHGLRHDDDDPVAPGGGHRGQPDAGVSGGGLDDDRAGLQQPPGLSVVNHGQGDPVLDAARGVEILQLGQNTGLQPLPRLNMGQLQQRGAADELVGGGINLGHLKYQPFILVIRIIGPRSGFVKGGLSFGCVPICPAV